MSGWQAERPDPRRYKPSGGLTIAQRAAEQDAASGGRQRRQVRRADGRVVAASVALRLPPKSRRVYAYLRWAGPERVTRERYLGDVSGARNRAEALRLAWSRVTGDPDMGAANVSGNRGETA